MLTERTSCHLWLICHGVTRGGQGESATGLAECNGKSHLLNDFCVFRNVFYN